jgi:hypothetical protein
LVLILPSHRCNIRDGWQVLNLSKGDGSLRTHAKVFIGQERNERLAGSGDPSITGEPCRKPTNLDLFVSKPCNNGSICLGIVLASISRMARLHSERPECVEPRLERPTSVRRNLRHRVGGLGATTRKFQMRTLANADVGMS